MTSDRDPLRGPHRSESIPRLCHRDSTPNATLPGAVSRFGLAPVHRPRENTQQASLGVGVVGRLLQHDTKRGHTLRALRTSHVWTGRSQDTLSPHHAVTGEVRGCEQRNRSLGALASSRAYMRQPRPPRPRNLPATPLRIAWRSSPSSTCLEHPSSSMCAREPWRDPPPPIDQDSIPSALSAKSERLVVNRGAFHRKDAE